MIWLGNKLNENYAWEFAAFHKHRDFSDGFSFVEFDTIWDKYLADHSPRFQIMLVICNYKIFEFNIYYRWHRDAVGEAILPNAMNECRCRLISHTDIEKRLDNALKD